jgi:hypothetical protein
VGEIEKHLQFDEKIYNFIAYSKILKIVINMIKTKCEGKRN